MFVSNRSKVGKGNRKVVRDHFRPIAEFPYGRDCVNERYSFKVGPYFSCAERNRQLRQIEALAESCPVPVDVVPTKEMNGYCMQFQYGVAVRFKDI